MLRLKARLHERAQLPSAPSDRTNPSGTSQPDNLYDFFALERTAATRGVSLTTTRLCDKALFLTCRGLIKDCGANELLNVLDVAHSNHSCAAAPAQRRLRLHGYYFRRPDHV